MPAAAPHPAPARVLVWGLVAVVLATAAAGGITVVRRIARPGPVLAPPAPPRVTHQVVVERLEAVARLVASQMTLRDVVVYEQTRFTATKRALLVVTGRVSAGIDLQRATDVAIDSAARRIVLTLPPAQLLAVEVLDVTTYDERAGLLNPFRPEDRDAIQREVRARLEDAARRSGILAHADQSAALMLQQLLGRDGYTVEIRRDPVQRAPTG
ncbi:DUF4230 domain-containing protein [Roseisolibacter sp. H3M3-2]|uniref:DUF4230 domain-containing protein n=1 Tax=Roseisolibacter sp. H3M3-2 TaxID=3031323 RepID=UPI0023DB3FB3|nr:DUF4230 domain-containing protein [Roseisolibacter sp. H3M3-2]MDF1502477.1 DUF4230 domain-containing protein [Roseisolibacter sp. H3M3-2]